MLSRFDDYPIHPTPEPLCHATTSDRNVYDRYWLNGYDPDGAFYFGVAMGLYPHRHVLDGSFSIAIDGEQHSFHASRRAPRERDETAIGPFRIEILEPMRRLRVVLDDNETGIGADLHFTARTASLEEARQTLRRGGRVIMDATRFTQWGRWSGEVRFAGRSLTLSEGSALGTKDRSWGVRPVGEPEPPGAPGTSPQIFFLWAPLHFDDCCTHVALFEEADGRRWHEEGAIVPAYGSPDEIPGIEDPARQPLHRAEFRIDYRPGTRWARAAALELVLRDGTRHEIALEPRLRFQMKGLGYLHPEWGHGVWKGELAIGGESWKLDALEPLRPDHLHVQQVMRARWGERIGAGVMEQLAIGPHAPSGFRELFDGAPA